MINNPMKDIQPFQVRQVKKVLAAGLKDAHMDDGAYSNTTI